MQNTVKECKMRLALAWPGLGLGLAWPGFGLAWPGLAWPGLLLAWPWPDRLACLGLTSPNTGLKSITKKKKNTFPHLHRKIFYAK